VPSSYFSPQMPQMANALTPSALILADAIGIVA
jgi:hypothetical protein